MRRKDANPTLEATEIAGQSKEARQARAVVLGGLMAQRKLLMLSTTPNKTGKVTIYAVIPGEDRSDGAFAEELRDAFNMRGEFVENMANWRQLLDGPDLSPEMNSPCWVGRCRRCDQVVGVVHDARGPETYAGTMRGIGQMVASGLFVYRAPDPGEYRRVCECGSSAEVERP